MPENKCKRNEGNQFCFQVSQMENNGKMFSFSLKNLGLNGTQNEPNQRLLVQNNDYAVRENIRRQMFALKFYLNYGSFFL